MELVTVPALGAEWGKNELKAMTKKGRKEEKSGDFGRKWRAFNRGQYGLFGRKWLTRRTVVFIVFALCAVYVFPPTLYPVMLTRLSFAASGSRSPLSSHAYPTLPSTGRILLRPPRAGITSPSRLNLVALLPTSPSLRIYSSRSTPTRTSCHSFSSV